MESRKEPDLNKAVFGNAVIWRYLSKYLVLEDLIALRTTNRFLYDHVSESKSYKNQMAIQMTNEALMEEDFVEFLEKFPKWKSLAVTLCDTKHREVKLMENFYPAILKSEVKDLKFYWKEGLKNPRNGCLGSVVFSVIALSPQLTKFEIEFVLLARIEFWDSSVQTKEILKNVTHFKIFQGRIGNCRFRFPLNYFKYNMLYFERVFFGLKSLTIEELPDVGIKNTPKVHLLIKNNSSTLESLILLYSAVWRRFRISQIVCPKLKTFHTIINVGYHNDMIFKDFFRNQPSLEDVGICIEGTFDIDVLSIVEQKHSRNLKGLHIKANKFSVGESPLPLQFLASTGLQEFSLVTAPGNCPGRIFGIEDCESLLQYLPPTLQSIKLRGLQLHPTLTFAANRLKFNRLTNCSLLNTLEFVRCTGLSGNRSWIKDLCGLHGLKNLTMRELDLTDEDIMQLKISSLKNLDVSGNKLLSPTAVQRVVNQNSSLEFLMCSQQGIVKQGRLTNIIYQA